MDGSSSSLGGLPSGTASVGRKVTALSFPTMPLACTCGSAWFGRVGTVPARVIDLPGERYNIIDTENFSFIEKKEALSAISIRFDEAEIELTGFSAHFASKLIMLDFAYSQNFRLMNHLTN